jgi:7-keto-8-aminopelargonate synthetase-like enzyme
LTFRDHRSTENNYVFIQGKKLLNCASINFYGFQHANPAIEVDISYYSHQRVPNILLNFSMFHWSKKAALDTLHTCGVGSCGPRNFYGTLDVHLDFEDRAAKFLGFEAAILYASSFSVTASVIPVFASREDYIIT